MPFDTETGDIVPGTDPGGNDPSSSVEAAAAYFARLIAGIELPKALADAGERLKRSSDAEAAGVGQRMTVASSAAKRDLTNIWNGIVTVLQNIESTPSGTNVYHGRATLTFAGGTPGESQTVTVSGHDWVVDQTVTHVWTIFNDAPGALSKAQFDGFSHWVDNYVAGDSFDVSLAATLAVHAGDYYVYWAAFIP